MRGEVRGRLQQQRGLADAGLAAEQHERPRHDAAAEDAVELADARTDPLERRRSRRPDRGATRRRPRPAPRRAARRPPRPRALRRANSTHRIPSNGRATWATGRRIADRRRRTWVASWAATSKFALRSSNFRGGSRHDDCFGSMIHATSHRVLPVTRIQIRLFHRRALHEACQAARIPTPPGPPGASGRYVGRCQPRRGQRCANPPRCNRQVLHCPERGARDCLLAAPIPSHQTDRAAPSQHAAR